jgi:hypothetical protein
LAFQTAIPARKFAQSHLQRLLFLPDSSNSQNAATPFTTALPRCRRALA